MHERASIVAHGGNGLLITTETGLVGMASVIDGVVVVSAWKVSGKMTPDFKSIHWSNGVIWNKVSSENP